MDDATQQKVDANFALKTAKTNLELLGYDDMAQTTQNLIDNLERPMDNEKIARDLVRLAKELMADRRLPRISGWEAEFDDMVGITYDKYNSAIDVTVSLNFQSRDFDLGLEDGLEAGGQWEVTYEFHGPDAERENDRGLQGTWQGLRDIEKIVKMVDRKAKYASDGRLKQASQSLQGTATMDNEKIAKKLVKLAKELVSKRPTIISSGLDRKTMRDKFVKAAKKGEQVEFVVWENGQTVKTVRLYPVKVERWSSDGLMVHGKKSPHENARPYFFKPTKTE